MSQSIIYYHNPCQDGFASMVIATLKLSNYVLKPFSHGQQFDMIFQDKIIYFLDMAPPRNIFDELKKHNRVIVLDHHISNKRDYEKEEEDVFFDMNRSGVGMAWKHFFGDIEMPYFLKLIQDRDLWQKNIKKLINFMKDYLLFNKPLNHLMNKLKCSPYYLMIRKKLIIIMILVKC